MGFSFRNLKYLFNPPEARIPAIPDDIPRYPPFDRGLPAVSVEQLIASQTDLIAQIKQNLSFDDPTHFDRYALPVIQGYAAHVHLLPASRSTHHRGAGGLFRHGLEVALYATKKIGANPAHFSESGQRERRDNKPRWFFAAFVAGLLHDCSKPITDVMVTTESGDLVWNPTEMLLLDWLRKNGISRYFMTWRSDRDGMHDAYASLGFSLIMPRSSMAYLTQPGPHIIASVYDAISGMSVTHPLSKAVAFGDKESTERDIEMMRLKGDSNAIDTPVHRFVFDALRSLSQLVQINQPGAPIWVSKSGVFVVWNIMAPLIQKYLVEARISGIPQNPDSLADLLIEKNFARINRPNRSAETQRYWTIAPEPLDGITLRVLYFDSPRLIFTDRVPDAINIKIVNEGDDEKSTDTTKRTVAAPENQVSTSPDDDLDIPFSSEEDDRPLEDYGVVTYTEQARAETSSPGSISTPDLPDTPAWSVIKAICADAIAGRSVLESLPGEVYGIEYPTALGSYGQPPDVRRLLVEAEMLKIDAVSGQLLRYKDKKFLVLNPHVSKVIRARVKQNHKEAPKPSPDKKPTSKVSNEAVAEINLDKTFPALHIFAQTIIEQMIEGSGSFIQNSVEKVEWNDLTTYIVDYSIVERIAEHYGVTPIAAHTQLLRVEDIRYDNKNHKFEYVG